MGNPGGASGFWASTDTDNNVGYNMWADLVCWGQTNNIPDYSYKTFSGVSLLSAIADTVDDHDPDFPGYGRGTPYDYATAYNPDDDLGKFSDAVGDYDDKVNAFDPEQDMKDAMEYAVAKLQELGFGDDTAVIALANAADTETEPEFERDLGSILSGYWDIGGVTGSQVRMEMSNALDIRLKSNRRRLLEWELLIGRDRMQALVNLVGTFLEARRGQLAAYQSLAGMRQSEAHMTIIAKQDQINHDTDTLVNKTNWNIEQILKGLNGLASTMGATHVQRQQTGRERLIGNVMNAASTGLQLGGAMGPAAGIIGGVADLALSSFAAGG